MLTFMELVLPLVLIVLISLPLVNVFRGNTSAQSAKVRVISHIAMFFVILAGVLVYHHQT